MNKRGFLRTLEAIIAVLIVLIFLFYITKGDSDDVQFVNNIRDLQESILTQISQNEGFRECIVNANENELVQIGNGDKCPEIKQFIENSLPNRFKNNFAFNVCDPGSLGTCSLPGEIDSKEEVYTSAVIITSTVSGEGNYNPRIFRIWFY